MSQLLIQTCLDENVQRPRQKWRRRQGIGSRPRTEHHVLDVQLMWQNGLHPNPTRLKLQASLPISNSPLRLHVKITLETPQELCSSCFVGNPLFSKEHGSFDPTFAFSTFDS